MRQDRRLVIEAGGAQRHYWADLWHYRELFYFLAWRDLLVRYKQTLLGVAWALVRPFLTMVVFTFVFSKLARLPSPSEDVPYPILVFAALLPWQLFSSAFADAGNSLVSNANMISKVYFPRLIVPAGSLIVSCVDFFLSLFMLAGLMAWYGLAPSLRILALPLFLILALGAALGAGLWTSALYVKYRDVRFIVPFVVQLGLFISPVGFSSTLVPEDWRFLYSLNPMVGVIEGFRWALLGRELELNGPALLISVLLTSLALVTGLMYFRHTERTFADVI